MTSYHSMATASPEGSNPAQGDQDKGASTEATANGNQRDNSVGSSTKEHKHHDSEPNPFERSFSGNAAGDAGKHSLPPVSNLASPGPNNSSMANAPGWSSFGSLRNGPLSPAMLLGPSGLGGFDGTLRTGLTPNESSIRTGLTPRGDNVWQLGSPGAIFNHFGGTGLTPGGNLNFLSGPGGSGMNDALFTRPHPPSHLGQDNGLQNNMVHNSKSNNSGSNANMSVNREDADAAANGLFLLSQHSQQQHAAHHAQDDLMRQAALNSAKNAGMSAPREDFDTSPAANRRGRRKSSFTDAESPPRDVKPVKKGRKAAPQQELSDSGNESDENQLDANGKPETDEQKRKNFLERNRQAALKCRQRKKQWLQNLQAKVEFYGHENDQLTSQVTSLREEIVNLKTMLLAHKDCPVARNNGIGNMNGMQQQMY